MRVGGGFGVPALRPAHPPTLDTPRADMAELDSPRTEIDVPGDWTYASAPESRDIVHIADRYGYYVGGEWLEPAETYGTMGPRDAEPLAAVGPGGGEGGGGA